ncbi:MAG: ferredoxin [Nanoarchaeota archaeon]|nr:ferredoxin [Nanoarchaeota archaeon]
MVKYNISQKHAECIGCQACVNVCPDNWVMDSSGKAKPKKTVITTAEELKCNKEAETSCPVQIIKVSKVK